MIQGIRCCAPQPIHSTFDCSLPLGFPEDSRSPIICFHSCADCSFGSLQLSDSPGRGRNSLHQESYGLLEGFGSRILTFVMAQSHDNKIVRRDDQGYLTACARHVVRLTGCRKIAAAIEPDYVRTAVWTPEGKYLSVCFLDKIVTARAAAPDACVKST